MLDTHDDGPPGIVPIDRQLQRCLADDAVDGGTHRVAVGAHLSGGRPVIVRFVEVVPTHLVDTHREHRLETRVDALADEARKYQLVGEEGRGMAQIENERMPQANRLDAVAVFVDQRLEERLIGAERAVEVICQRLAKRRLIALAKVGRARKQQLRGQIHASASLYWVLDAMSAPDGFEHHTSRTVQNGDGHAKRGSGCDNGCRQRQPACLARHPCTSSTATWP